jgi:hypothetical protein
LTSIAHNGAVGAAPGHWSRWRQRTS